MRCSLVGRFKGQALICGSDFAREILKSGRRPGTHYEFPEGSFCHPNGSANERSESWLCGRPLRFPVTCSSSTAARARTRALWQSTLSGSLPWKWMRNSWRRRSAT